MGTTLTPRLRAWFEEHLQPPDGLSLRQLAGGQSNHTYVVEGADRPMVLRRPPPASVHTSAHNMEREHCILVALGHTDVPAPAPLAYCDDLEVIGAPFLVMEMIDGHCLREELPPEAPDGPVAAREVGCALVGALAALHGVDWAAVGLSRFGRPDGFLERQVSRWSRQYRQIQVRELPLFDEVARWLEEHRPPPGDATIVHGDFHADNTLTVFAGPARISAILDWEMATIGDPLLDLGLLLAFWGGDDRPVRMAFPEVQGFSRVSGSPSRTELAGQYADLTGRSVDNLGYYMALALWKLAAIVEGSYANALAGRTDAAHAYAMETEVPRLLAEAAGAAHIVS